MATNSALTFADGMAVRVPDATALEVIRKGAERIVEVTEDEIAEAIRSIYSATHNCAEGAGAAALAALMKERADLQGRRAAVILTGQNIDRAWCKPFWRAQHPAYSTWSDVRLWGNSGHRQKVF